MDVDPVEGAASAAPPEPPPEPAQAPPKRTLWQRVTPFLPWLSMAMSVTGAVLMDRSETRATWVAGASAASWLVLVIVTLAHRPRAAEAGSTGALTKVIRFGTVTANQSLIHVSLFFCAPLYAQVFAFTPLELVFAALFIAALGISLWDPLCEHVLLHPLFGPLLLAFSSFVGWNAVLPMLGIPHRTGVWLAAGAVSVALPLVQLVSHMSKKRLLGALSVSVALPLALFLGGVRALPPAPLKLVYGAIGTRVVERTLVDPQASFASAPPALVCFTAIRAPFGLSDALVHEWRHDGELTHAIRLDVRGGRKAGFRTWSRLPLPAHASGTYRCDVVTTLGQVVGTSEVQVGR